MNSYISNDGRLVFSPVDLSYAVKQPEVDLSLVSKEDAKQLFILPATKEGELIAKLIQATETHSSAIPSYISNFCTMTASGKKVIQQNGRVVSIDEILRQDNPEKLRFVISRLSEQAALLNKLLISKEMLQCRE